MVDVNSLGSSPQGKDGHGSGYKNVCQVSVKRDNVSVKRDNALYGQDQ